MSRPVATYGAGCVDVGRYVLWAGCGPDARSADLWWTDASAAALYSASSCSPWSDTLRRSCGTSWALHKMTKQLFTSLSTVYKITSKQLQGTFDFTDHQKFERVLGLESREFFASRNRVQFRDDITISSPVVRPLVLPAWPWCSHLALLLVHLLAPPCPARHLSRPGN